MKILGLHGMGTSGSIFRSQSASFRAKLPSDWEWDFPDGPFSAKPHPGIDMIFNSPTYCAWWTQNTANAVRAASLWVEEYMAAHGPYDAVVCFSQGCALVGSYLLYHARESPATPLPFGAAVFICGGLPFPVLEDLGLAVPPRAHALGERTVALMRAKSAALYDLGRLPRGQGLWDDTRDLEHHGDELPDEADCFGLDFTQFPAEVRIKIPTAHIYGAKDPRWPAGIQLAYFCDDRRMYDHMGGHDIPRTTVVSEKIAELVKEVSGLGKEPSG